MTHEVIGDRAEPRIAAMIRVDVPGRPPSTNDSNRQVAAARWRIRREWRSTAGSFGTAARLSWESRHGLKWETLKQADLEVRFILPDARRRDLDNLISTLKPLLDGIVDAGLIADDSIECIVGFSVSFGIRKGVTSTEFVIREFEP